MDRTLVLKFDERVLVLAGVLLVIAAVALPWTTLPSFLAGDLARQGANSGGVLTLGLAALAALSLLLPWHPLRRVSLPAAVLAVLIDLVALLNFIRVIRLAGTLEMSLSTQLSSVGSGLYLTFAGVLLMLFGGLMGVTPTASPSASAAPTAWHPRWLGLAGWLALFAALASSCLCAWGVGLLLRPAALTTGGTKGSPTFAPAPTTYLATPLVDVRPEPLGGAPTVSAPTTFPPLAATAQIVTATPTLHLPTPTLRRSPLVPSASSTLPVIGAPTHTPTSTSTRTPTYTHTVTPPSSALETPTQTATPTATSPST